MKKKKKCVLCGEEILRGKLCKKCKIETSENFSEEFNDVMNYAEELWNKFDDIKNGGKL